MLLKIINMKYNISSLETILLIKLEISTEKVYYYLCLHIYTTDNYQTSEYFKVTNPSMPRLRLSAVADSLVVL